MAITIEPGGEWVPGDRVTVTVTYPEPCRDPLHHVLQLEGEPLSIHAGDQMTSASNGRSESAQTLVLSVLMLTVLLGFAMLVIDGGNFLMHKRAGNLTGNKRGSTGGFSARIGGNTEAFYEVFGQAADGSWYVKNPDSPRLG